MRKTFLSDFSLCFSTDTNLRNFSLHCGDGMFMGDFDAFSSFLGFVVNFKSVEFCNEWLINSFFLCGVWSFGAVGECLSFCALFWNCPIISLDRC